MFKSHRNKGSNTLIKEVDRALGYLDKDASQKVGILSQFVNRC